MSWELGASWSELEVSWSELGVSRSKLEQGGSKGSWEVLMLVDSEVVARVSGAAETVDYFG